MTNVAATDESFRSFFVEKDHGGGGGGVGGKRPKTMPRWHKFTTFPIRYENF